MSYITTYLPKMASMLAAVAITFCVQGLLLAGFDEMAREAQVNASASANQLAAQPQAQGVLDAQG